MGLDQKEARETGLKKPEPMKPDPRIEAFNTVARVINTPKEERTDADYNAGIRAIGTLLDIGKRTEPSPEKG